MTCHFSTDNVIQNINNGLLVLLMLFAIRPGSSLYFVLDLLNHACLYLLSCVVVLRPVVCRFGTHEYCGCTPLGIGARIRRASVVTEVSTWKRGQRIGTEILLNEKKYKLWYKRVTQYTAPSFESFDGDDV